MSEQELQRYVEDLLAGRRPRAFHPDETEADMLRAATTLRAARPGAATAGEEFSTTLRRRLAAEFGESRVAPTERKAAAPRRRKVLLGAAAAAAAAAGGAAVDHALSAGPPPPAAAPPSPSPQALQPNEGSWQAVAAADAVPEGGAAAFDTGTVRGFVFRRKGIVYGLSGVCTHQGCVLWLDAPAERLRCPCHLTSFDAQGQAVSHQLPQAPAPLPRLQVRENDDSIEVFVPTRT